MYRCTISLATSGAKCLNLQMYATKGVLVSKDLLNKPAPDFALPDTTGRTIRLSHYKGVKNVVLVLNRGFA